MRLLTCVVLLLCSSAHAQLAAGHGTTNNYLTWKECRKLVCNGVHDDGPALNACLAAMPNNSVFRLPPGRVCLTTQKLVLDNRAWVVFGGEGPQEDQANILWAGPPDNSCVLELNRLHVSKIENLSIRTNGSNNTAKCGISLRNTSGGFNSTDVTFDKVAVIQGEAIAQTPADYQAFVINPDNNSNLEHISFRGVTVMCGQATAATARGRGIDSNFNFNQKGYEFNRITVTGCAVGINGPPGSLAIDGAQFNSNGIDVSVATIDYCDIRNVDSENSGQFVSTAGCGIHHARVGAPRPPSGKAAIEVGGAGGQQGVTIEDVVMYDVLAGDKFIGCAPADNTTVLTLARNRYIYTTAVDALPEEVYGSIRASCGGVVDVGYKTYGGANGIVFMGPSSGGYSPTTGPTTGNTYPSKTRAPSAFSPGITAAGVLTYDVGASGYPLQKLMLSEDGGSYEAVRPGQSAQDPGCSTEHDVGRMWVSSASTTIWRRCTKVLDVIGWVVF